MKWRGSLSVLTIQNDGFGVVLFVLLSFVFLISLISVFMPHKEKKVLCCSPVGQQLEVQFNKQAEK